MRDYPNLTAVKIALILIVLCIAVGLIYAVVSRVQPPDPAPPTPTYTALPPSVTLPPTHTSIPPTHTSTPPPDTSTPTHTPTRTLPPTLTPRPVTSTPAAKPLPSAVWGSPTPRPVEISSPPEPQTLPATGETIFPFWLGLALLALTAFLVLALIVLVVDDYAH